MDYVIGKYEELKPNLDSIIIKSIHFYENYYDRDIIDGIKNDIMILLYNIKNITLNTIKKSKLI